MDYTIIKVATFKLPIPVDDSYDFPSYSHWVSKVFKRGREENKVGG